MAMDYRKTTYRPNRTDNRFRTSYALMSQWMNRKGSGQAYKREPIPQTFAIAMQGNAAFPKKAVPASLEFEPGRDLTEMDPTMAHVTAQQAALDENVPVHLRYSDGNGYDDFHKAFQQFSKHAPTTSFPEFGPARLRHGRAGGSWRHVKEVLQAGGARIVFVDGVVRWADEVKMDEIPGGHLIQPKVGEIKSRYMTPSRQNKASAAADDSMIVNRPSERQPVFRRSKTDMPMSASKAHKTEWALNQKTGIEKNNWLVMR